MWYIVYGIYIYIVYGIGYVVEIYIYSLQLRNILKSILRSEEYDLGCIPQLRTFGRSGFM